MHSNIRSLALGNVAIGMGHLVTSDMFFAVGSFRKAVDVAEDPVYFFWGNACHEDVNTQVPSAFMSPNCYNIC
jgi:hypothetical protein